MSDEVIIQPELPKEQNSFSWKRTGKTIFAILLLAVVATGVYFFVTYNPVKIAWASIAHNRREHFTDCEHLPFYGQVEKAFIQHKDIVDKVKAVPGVVDFKPEEHWCKIFEQGTQFVKGNGLLIYSSKAARTEAEKIIGKDFFGFPYHGYVQ